MRLKTAKESDLVVFGKHSMKKLEWTPERDARLIELVKKEPTVSLAAEKMGISYCAASKRLNRLGVFKRLLSREVGRNG